MRRPELIPNDHCHVFRPYPTEDDTEVVDDMLTSEDRLQGVPPRMSSTQSVPRLSAAGEGGGSSPREEEEAGETNPTLGNINEEGFNRVNQAQISGPYMHLSGKTLKKHAFST